MVKIIVSEFAEEIKFFHNQLEAVEKGELKTYTLDELKAKVKQKFAIDHGEKN